MIIVEYILAFIYFCVTPSLWFRVYRVLLLTIIQVIPKKKVKAPLSQGKASQLICSACTEIQVADLRRRYNIYNQKLSLEQYLRPEKGPYLHLLTRT